MRIFKNNTFWRYVLCYILVLALPMSVVLVLFDSQYLNRYRSEVISQITSTADRAMLNLDMNISQLHALTLQLGLDDSFSPRKISSSTISYSDIRNELRDYTNTNLILQDMAYFNSEYPYMIYTDKGTFTSKYYQTYISDTNELSAPEFYAGLTSSRWITADDISMRSKMFDGTVELACPVPMLDSGYVSFFLPIRMLLGMVAMPDTAIENLAIFTREGNVLVSQNDDAEFVDSASGAISEMDTGARIDSVFRQLSGGGYLLCVKGSSSDLICAYEISKSAVMGKSEALRRNYYLTVAAVLLICGVAVYVISLWQVRPINSLVAIARSMTTDSDNPADVNQNAVANKRQFYDSGDFGQIRTALEQVHTQNEKLRSENLRAARKTVLMRLISGQYMQRWELDQDCIIAMMPLEKGRCAVLLMDAQPVSTEELSKEMPLLLDEDGRIDVYGFRYSEQACQVYLLLIKDDSINRAEIIARINQSYPNENAHLGEIYDNPLHAFESYQDATFNRRRAATSSSDANNSIAEIEENIIGHRQGDGNAASDEVLLYPKQEIDALYNILLQKNSEKLAFIHEVLIHAVKEKADSAFFQRSLCYDIINTYNRALARMGVSRLSDTDRYTEYSQHGILYFDALIQNIDELYDEAIELFDQQAEPEDNGEMTGVIEFVNEHAEDPEMSVGYVADKFDMSISNLSHQFKNQTGNNISEYIASRKFEYACRMLCTSDISVNDIATRMGYSHPSSFIRMFRRTYGITPKQYRDTYSTNLSQEFDANDNPDANYME